MKLRALLIVVAILAVLSTAVYVARRPSSSLEVDARIGQRLADPNLVEKAAQFRITDQGKTVVLARQPDGMWRVKSFFDLPADFSKITGLAGSLTDARIQRVVSTAAKRIGRLGLNDTQIVLLDAGNKQLWSVMFGKNAEEGGRFVLYGTEQKAYLSSFDAAIDGESKNWADTGLLSLKADDVAKAEIGTAEGKSILISRATKDDEWKSAQAPLGKKIDGKKVLALLVSFGNLRFTEASDLDDPSFTAAKATARMYKLSTFDGKTINVTLYRRPEEKTAPTVPSTATNGGSPSASTVSKVEGVAPTIVGGPSNNPGDAPVPPFANRTANPVFVVINHSDTAAPVNTMMQKRAFQIAEFIFAGLPQNIEELFEPAVDETASGKSAGEKIPAQIPK